MLGLADRARIIDLFAELMRGDIAAALGLYRAQYDGGADPAVLLTELAEFTHLVTRLRYVPSAAGDASLTEDERRRGVEYSRTLSIRVLARTWQMLLKAIAEVQASSRPVAAGEMALIRIAHAADLPTLDEAIRSLEGGTGPAIEAKPEARESLPSPQPQAIARQQPAMSAGNGSAMRALEPSPSPSSSPDPAPVVTVATLADVVSLAETHRDIKLKVQIRQFLRLVRIEPGHIVVALASDAPKTLMTELSTKLKAWTGRTWLVSVATETVAVQAAPTLAETAASKREAAFSDARADPAVAAILERFPGAKVIDVRIPDSVAEPDAVAPDLPIEPGIDPTDSDDET